VPVRLLRLGFSALTLTAIAVNLANAFALLVAWAGNARRRRGVASAA
jgi:hypothetical protein